MTGLRVAAATVAAASWGCAPTQTPQDLSCQRSSQSVAATDDTLGFTAEDVLALVQLNLPEQIRWDEATLTGEVDSLQLQITGPAGDVRIATPQSSQPICPEPGPTLLVPVSLSLSIGDGQVVASGTTDLDVGALALDRIHLTTGWSIPAALSGDYAAALDAWFDEEYASKGYVLDGTWLTSASTWAQGEVDIDLQGSSADEGFAAMAWRGRWE